MRLLRKLLGLLQHEKRDADMRDELGAHVDLQIAENMRHGMSADEARVAARRAFGGAEQIKERCRDERARGFLWLEHLAQDVRYAVRALRKSPGFTAVVVVSLALGIGANTAVFSLVNAFLLRPLPVRNPDELILFRVVNGRTGGMAFATEGPGSRDPATGRAWHGTFSPPAFERFRASHSALTDVCAFTPFYPKAVIDGQTEMSVTCQLVSGNYHALLGVPAAMGRTLLPEDDRAAAEPVAVISHRYWRTRFGADPAILGRTVELNRVVVTIVGVTPEGFDGALQAGQSADITAALGMFSRFEPERGDKLQPWYWWLRVLGRLAPGATGTQACASLQSALDETIREGWQMLPRPPGTAVPDMPELPTLAFESGARGENDLRHEFEKPLALVMGIVGLVLLAACANVANLLLARAASRRREIAVRLALGASRGRVIRQLLTESIVLAGAGAALGVLFAAWGRGLLLAMRPVGDVASLDLSLDATVFAFTAGVAGATALLFGLAPALRATRVDLTVEFQGGARLLGGGARSWLSRTPMVVQLALSLVLLVGTGLFLRTLRNLQQVDTGFNRRGLVLFRIQANLDYTPEQRLALNARLQQRFASLPGVTAATYSDIALISGRRTGRQIVIAGYTPPDGGKIGAQTLSVADNFFPAMELPLLLGRGFTARDDAAAPKVAVVNQAFAREFFGVESAVGRRFAWLRARGPGEEMEIVGVVRDANYTDLRDPARGTIYTPLAQQSPDGTVNFALRTSGDGAALFPAIRAVLREIDPNLPAYNLRTQDAQIERLNAQPILFARLSGLFGALAVALAAVGLYGLMSYQVLRRTGEIGLRMALGAQTRNILGLILRESLTLVVAGVIVGLALAACASRLVVSMLFGVSPLDPLTYGALALVLIAIALLAGLLPARRAAKIDPMHALRAE